ncbi:Chalcone--flavonone isomerase [Thalictrum thalictroides]|uniref:Chalcone-flavonone isomerase family protein n=1 Tax=Thalictrum thalictroides TaxID=46969 RepID=A0A7J6UXW5_THATH|nr:Chalcone--flavonone isomerase [Thalictrum thalictroides]
MGELIESMFSELKVEDYTFCPTLSTVPGSANSFCLGGAGVRGMQIQDKFIKFTAIGVYLEEQKAISSLSMKWKGKSAEELTDSIEFFRDIVTGPFEKFVMVTMILPLTGQQYSEKVAENCVAAWKAMGIYTEAESKAVEEFIQVFKDETFPPGSSILFTQSSPTLTIGFSKDGSIPKEVKATIANKPLSEAVLESIIGKHGVSPEAKCSLAVRISELMKNQGDTLEEGALQKVENGVPAKIYPLPN